MKFSTILLYTGDESAEKETPSSFPGEDVGLWIYAPGCNSCLRFQVIFSTFSKVGDDRKPW
jgi:hypothetical protein